MAQKWPEKGHCQLEPKYYLSVLSTCARVCLTSCKRNQGKLISHFEESLQNVAKNGENWALSGLFFSLVTLLHGFFPPMLMYEIDLYVQEESKNTIGNNIRQLNTVLLTVVQGKQWEVVQHVQHLRYIQYLHLSPGQMLHEQISS